MNTAEWILVMFLSVALLVFLLLAVILIAKLIGLVKEIRRIVITGQDIADNVKDMTSIGGLVKVVTDKLKGEKDGKKAKE